MIKFILLGYLILTMVSLVYGVIACYIFAIPVMKEVKRQNKNKSILLSNSNAIYTSKR